MVNSILPLTLKHVVVRRRGKRLIGPVSLTLQAEGVTIVIGPNGSGKTTLLRSMHGIERLSEGSLAWQVPEAQTRGRQSFVFQTPIMLRRSVRENLVYPLALNKVAAAQQDERARHWAAQIHLDGALNPQATVLSGGERQKLALARALIRKPDVLFLDEPCANLDGRAIREIEEILLRAKAAGTRLIMATHDMGQARRLATEVVFMHRGQVCEMTPAGDFFERPATSEAAAFLKGDILE